MNEFMDDADLKAAQESRRKRRAELVETIKRAGINPAEIDLTTVMSSEEQAQLLRQMAERNEARRVAEQFGRKALREKLKRTIDSSIQKNNDIDLGLDKRNTG